MYICVMKTQNCLRPVDADHRGLVFLCAGFAYEGDQIVKDFSGEIAAAPVKGKDFSFFGCLEGTFVYVFLFGERQFPFFIIEMFVVCTVRCGCDQWFMVTEDLLVIQVEIVISDFGIFIFTESVVKGSIQMVVSTVDPDDIPGMAVFDAFIRVVSADGNDAPDTQSIQ